MWTGHNVPNNMLAVLHKLTYAQKMVAKLHHPYNEFVNASIFQFRFSIRNWDKYTYWQVISIF